MTLPIIESGYDSVICSVCLLPMQYQKKIDKKFLWQCFKCGKKYYVFYNSDKLCIEETWSPTK